MSTVEHAVLMGREQLDVSSYRDPAPVLALLREANQDRVDRHVGGCVWLFQLGDESTDPCLAVGVRGNVGALVWYARPGRFVPGNGMNGEYIDYWTWTGHESPMRPGAEVPIDQVYEAVDELIRTHQRPTCVAWTTA
jgi:hypothetical protein